MTNQAPIYHRPSKWPIATALGTAVVIHLSAVAVAFHRESPATLPAIEDDFVPFGFEPADDPPIPPDPDISLLPPASPPTVDFIEAHDIERAIKPHRNPRSRSFSRTDATVHGHECPATRLSVRSTQPSPHRKRYRRH